MSRNFRFYYDQMYSDDSRLALYDKIRLAAQKGEKVIHFRHEPWMGDGDELTKAISNVVFNVVNDDPLLFWLHNAFTWWKNGNNIKLELVYRYSRNVYERKLAMVRKETDALIAALFPHGWEQLSEIHREKILFDDLIRRAIYRYDAVERLNEQSLQEEFTDAWTPYGVLVEKRAVCQGIANTFKMLCDQVDLPCIVVIGDASGRHAWNMVRIDRRFFWVDCTWNLSENFVREFPYMRYQFFNVPDRLMAVHRTMDCSVLPECTSLRYNPFTMRGLCVKEKEQVIPTAVRLISQGMDRFALLLDFPERSRLDLTAIANETAIQVRHSIRVNQDSYNNFIGFVVEK